MKVTLRGTNYRLTLSPLPGNRLPKRSNGTVELLVNGAPFTAPVTNSVGFSAPGKAIYYPWILIDGKAYYLALDYDTKASEIAGENLTVSEGSAERPDPVRVPKSAESEADRVRKFRETYALKTA